MIDDSEDKLPIDIPCDHTTRYLTPYVTVETGIRVALLVCSRCHKVLEVMTIKKGDLCV
jgi:hypothetical protein